MISTLEKFQNFLFDFFFVFIEVKYRNLWLKIELNEMTILSDDLRNFNHHEHTFNGHWSISSSWYLVKKKF